jgi:hypothetical protein
VGSSLCQAAVKFIKLAKDMDSSLIFIAISAVSPAKLQEGLGVYTYNVYVTGICPLTSDTSSEVVGSLKTALNAYNASLRPSVINLEGYIVGRLVIEGFKKMYVGKTGKLLTSEITSSGFLSSFSRKVTYSIDDIALGPCMLCHHHHHLSIHSSVWLWLIRICGKHMTSRRGCM